MRTWFWTLDVSEKYCFGGGLGEACQFIRSANSWMLGHIVTMALSGGYIPSERGSFLWWEFANSVQKQIFTLGTSPTLEILLYQQSGFTSPLTVSLVATNWRFVYLVPVCYYVFGNILSLLKYLNAIISRLCYCKPAFEMLARLLCWWAVLFSESVNLLFCKRRVLLGWVVS